MQVSAAKIPVCSRKVVQNECLKSCALRIMSSPCHSRDQARLQAHRVKSQVAECLWVKPSRKPYTVALQRDLQPYDLLKRHRCVALLVFCKLKDSGSSCISKYIFTILAGALMVRSWARYQRVCKKSSSTFSIRRTIALRSSITRRSRSFDRSCRYFLARLSLTMCK